jgi:hypothetical protein
MNSSFDKGLAAGLRRGTGKRANKLIDEMYERFDHGEKRSPLTVLQANGFVSSIHRRPPSQGKPAGQDVLIIDATGANGETAIVLGEFDKRGRPLRRQFFRMLLCLTQHAVESLFQRLRTTSSSPVFDELRSLSPWVYEHRRDVGVGEGILLSRSGFFLVLPASPLLSIEAGLNGLQHWDATTWIADGGMEDHTPGKRRVAVAVRRARERGMTAGFLIP